MRSRTCRRRLLAAVRCTLAQCVGARLLVALRIAWGAVYVASHVVLARLFPWMSDWARLAASGLALASPAAALLPWLRSPRAGDAAVSQQSGVLPLPIVGTQLARLAGAAAVPLLQRVLPASARRALSRLRSRVLCCKGVGAGAGAGAGAEYVELVDLDTDALLGAGGSGGGSNDGDDDDDDDEQEDIFVVDARRR